MYVYVISYHYQICNYGWGVNARLEDPPTYLFMFRLLSKASSHVTSVSESLVVSVPLPVAHENVPSGWVWGPPALLCIVMYFL